MRLAGGAVVLRNIAIVKGRVLDGHTNVRIIPILETHSRELVRPMKSPGRANVQLASRLLRLAVIADELGPVRIRLERVIADTAFVIDLKQDVIEAALDNCIYDLSDKTLLER